jgi:hypothetical protein
VAARTTGCAAVVLASAATAVVALPAVATGVATRLPAIVAPSLPARRPARGALGSAAGESTRCEEGGWWWFIAGSVLDVDLLEEEKRARLIKRGEGAVKLQVGHHVAKSSVETADQRQHESLVANRIAELSESARHRLQAPTVVGDVESTLLELAELGGEQESA